MIYGPHGDGSHPLHCWNGFESFPTFQDPTKNWWTLWILMDVSRNRGTPKWFIMENPIKMDDLGVPLSLETPLYTRNFYSKPIKDKIWRVDMAQNDWAWHHLWFLVQELRCLEPRQISVSKNISRIAQHEVSMVFPQNYSYGFNLPKLWIKWLKFSTKWKDHTTRRTKAMSTGPQHVVGGGGRLVVVAVGFLMVYPVELGKRHRATRPRQLQQ